VRGERKNDPFLFEKDQRVHRWFWNQFQHDFYQTAIIPKKKPICEMKWIDWDYMAKCEDTTFDSIIEACERLGVKELMSFKYEWNEEVLLQFHTSFYYDKSQNTIH